jgi:TrmH family RNA methyltransferase
MIALSKLLAIPGRARLRKAALVLTELQTGIMAGRYGKPELVFIKNLASILSESPGTPSATRAACDALLADRDFLAAATESGAVGLRNLDALRHALMADTGQSPADWDLIDPSTGRLSASGASALPGLRVYCEDIRSPFNLGSIFRSCDAFGAGELILSPASADPAHRRCARSAMGATGTLPHSRAALEVLSSLGPAFALELGGAAIEDFAFPREGIVVLGSEELGVSREALELCPLGAVSIPMRGAKASLNVAVACGILLHAWRSSLGF